MPNPRLEIQYATLAQQSETAQLGMWVFLATEVLFFGGIMLGYEVYRSSYPEPFAKAMRESIIVIGGINTAILLTSSLTMALAVHWTATGAPRLATRALWATAALGLAFLALKGLEYYIDYQDHVVPRLGFHIEGAPRGPAELFWLFYFYATGLHALHLSIGIVVIVVMAIRSARRAFTPGDYNPLEVAGLYWSFIDVVWVFLFALIYPVGRLVS
ncbi:MAG TPA: cytochrome c oxidase subunit 3 [Alphaproteobacteria bacterium]|nr:cytochrome c oxidase subunit 3 [Alphaproteobacteria bacterium]